MRAILVGLGVVGQSLLQMLSERYEELRDRYGIGLRLVAVADSGGAITKASGLNPARVLQAKRAGGLKSLGDGNFTDDPLGLIGELEADILIDATPTNIVDGEPSYSYIRSAILHGLDVVTVSKGGLALYFPALKELAAHRGVVLRFSGTVGGGMPAIEFGKECGRSDRLEKVVGVLNGTTNYILSRMEDTGQTFRDALGEAQRLGYAERDPTLDISGLDTACKITILANEVLGMGATLSDVRVSGIEEIDVDEVRAARERGLAVRLLGVADGRRLEVSPQTVGERDPLAVKGALNAVTFKASYSGSHTITGKGAGGPETATSILRDLVAIKMVRVAEVSRI
ncbi:Homoserine dehydrogenase [archaeon HR01]|nr:Homoserine dehydrogenase [archaeon HR01]